MFDYKQIIENTAPNAPMTFRVFSETKCKNASTAIRRAIKFVASDLVYIPDDEMEKVILMAEHDVVQRGGYVFDQSSDSNRTFMNFKVTPIAKGFKVSAICRFW